MEVLQRNTGMEGIALEILGPPRLSKLLFFISPYGLPPYQLFSYEPALDQLAVESKHPSPIASVLSK